MPVFLLVISRNDIVVRSRPAASKDDGTGGARSESGFDPGTENPGHPPANLGCEEGRLIELGNGAAPLPKPNPRPRCVAHHRNLKMRGGWLSLFFLAFAEGYLLGSTTTVPSTRVPSTCTRASTPVRRPKSIEPCTPCSEMQTPFPVSVQAPCSEMQTPFPSQVASISVERFLADLEFIGPCRFVVVGNGAILEAIGAFESLRMNAEKGLATVSATIHILPASLLPRYHREMLTTHAQSISGFQ